MSVRLKCDRPGCDAEVEAEWFPQLLATRLSADVQLPYGWVMWTPPTIIDSQIRCPEHARSL